MADPIARPICRRPAGEHDHSCNCGRDGYIISLGSPRSSRAGEEGGPGLPVGTTRPAPAACRVQAHSSPCVCVLPYGHRERHRCAHGAFGSRGPLDERIYYALINAGLDETDAGTATRVALQEVGRVH